MQNCYICGKEALLLCHVCKQYVCSEHVANPKDFRPGDYVACPEHLEQVQAINDEIWEKVRKRD